MEEETLFLFIPYAIKNLDDRIEGSRYAYSINRASIKRSDTGERYKRTPVYFQPVVGNTCYVIAIINSGRPKDGLYEAIYFPFIFDSLDLAKKEKELIDTGEYRKYLHTKEKFIRSEILTLKITEY